MEQEKSPILSQEKPTVKCPHWEDLKLVTLKEKFSQPAFRKCLGENKGTCIECKEHFTLKDLWACLLCRDGALRCGRRANKDALKHGKEHGLVLNMDNRMIWCYLCDDEITDLELDKDQAGDLCLPQDVRACLTREEKTEETKEVAPPRRLRFEDFYYNKNGGRMGLSNMGNTCFMNSGLQALLHCPPLIAYFCELGQLPSRNEKVRLAEEFSLLTMRTWLGQDRVCRPAGVVERMTRLNPYFHGYGQHDSQEFVRSLLDNLHEGLKVTVEYDYAAQDKKSEVDEEIGSKGTKKKKQKGADKREEKGKDKDTKEDTKDKKTKEKEEKEKEKKRSKSLSIIGDIFQGYLCSQVTCCNCNNVSSVLDPFYDLSLEIPKSPQLKKVGQERGQQALTPTTSQHWIGSILSYVGITNPPLSLETCLHSFCTSEELIKREQYRCDKCKEKVNAVKTLSVAILPEVLCLHIKRFSHNSMWGNKLSRHVMFPLKGLNMDSFISKKYTKDPRNVDATYDLCSIVRHIGGVGGGHYIAYAKHHVTDQWYEFDDHMVTPMTAEEVSNQEAYILFYRRVVSQSRLDACLEKVNASLSEELPRRWISKAWKKKVTMLAPCPIDNRSLCCPHGFPRYYIEDGDATKLQEVAFSVSKKGYDELIQQYGGGPMVDGEKHSCEVCEAIAARDREKSEIIQLEAEVAKRGGARDEWYLIHTGWIKVWKVWIDDAKTRPGPVSNHELLEGDRITPKKGLEYNKDYRTIHKVLWEKFISLHGGGPTIVRVSNDIYSSPPPPPGSTPPSTSSSPPSPSPSLSSPSPSSPPASPPSASQHPQQRQQQQRGPSASTEGRGGTPPKSGTGGSAGGTARRASGTPRTGAQVAADAQAAALAAAAAATLAPTSSGSAKSTSTTTRGSRSSSSSSTSTSPSTSS